ncbi:MAG: hypothetical protein COW00_14650 [Bdellovibrio sp. CG12_big_fil_rev_8_21_14_0_65_39_13]|nr:MAG: hypothetical protein COW78_14990 [Bdellovibrio sp. CG22_combo_CG10-13_8_21_14_all_39_27]PIQ58638.1 MAG: hypothetical protein COW00_14650 [Bdellovibrio sp. CG12_big_fil_rev_8_21_14_0_65_39_13]PIR33384.1 MAG: hypothetical protein COV37_16520 [Bdellovibrio sp. CG11_big_fil_rev_8_21_14_0_20_39_38]
MSNKVMAILVMMTLCGCSSLKKTIIYSSLAGAMTGATAGVLLSPDRESRGANAVVFGVLGAGIAAITGYALFEDDPRNYKLKNMLRDEEKINPNEIELGLGDIKIDALLEKKEAYPVPVTELPDQLKGKVNQQFLIKYQSKERYVKKGNKTFYIPAFEVFEHAYDQQLEGEKNGVQK